MRRVFVADPLALGVLGRWEWTFADPRMQVHFHEEHEHIYSNFHQDGSSAWSDDHFACNYRQLRELLD